MKRARGEVMTCMETQSLITPFINNQLDMAKLELFLNHIQSCKTCKEELQVYYALLTAISQLDDDRDLSDNFNEELELKIISCQKQIKRRKNAVIRKKFYLMALSLSFVILSSISVGKVIIPVIKPKEVSFQFNYEGIPDYMNPMNDFVNKYDKQAQIYIERNKKERLMIYMWEQDHRVEQLIFENKIKKDTKNEK